MTDDERVAKLRRLIELDPADPVAHFGLGRAALEAGLAEEAARAFARAVELKPDWSAAYRDLGRARLELGQAELALETFARGIEIARARGDLQTVREMEVFSKRAGRILKRS